jgi:tRNA 5-methylaminomethyl-2-thiouridine biosynthesis bifunctional protein
MSPTMNPVELSWDKDTPLSKQHQDFYFSLKNGLDESNYVFVNANNLCRRFTVGDLSKPFVIVETGFGTGLNFLATWEAWNSVSGHKRPLHFISVEKYPLSKTDLKTCLDCWPQLANLSDRLHSQYPDLVSGMHRIAFEGTQVTLSLIFGDVNRDLDEHDFVADCWFLDGFSPRKNPSMWTDQLFEIMAKHSNAGTSLSTFTAASVVRKGLECAGFRVSKWPGFGAKREMIRAELSKTDLG